MSDYLSVRILISNAIITIALTYINLLTTKSKSGNLV